MNASKQRPASPGAAAPRGKKSVRSLVIGGALCFAAGYGFAMLPIWPRHGSEASASAAGGAAHEATARPRSQPKHAHRIERPFLTRPTEPCAASDPEAEQRYETQQAREFMELLSWRIKVATPMGLELGPEAVANQLTPYVSGWADALVRTAPELADELATEIESVMCDSKAKASQQIVMSRLMQNIPELSNERTFDCIVARGKEDIVLWEALDAWRLSTLPKTPAIERLERAVTDERTRRRLVKRTEEIEAASPPPDLDPPSVQAPAGQLAEDRPQLMPNLHEAALALALSDARTRGDEKRAQTLTAALEALRADGPANGPRAPAGPSEEARADAVEP